MLKPRRLHLNIDNTYSQKPFAKQKDFDLGFESSSMNRSWLTFEIENTEIKIVENGFFSKCKLRSGTELLRVAIPGECRCAVDSAFVTSSVITDNYKWIFVDKELY